MVSEDLSLPDLPNDTQADVQAEEAELGTVENHKSIVMHLLSQLKNGMDLTKVVLPTFILQKRSLLEMFADHLAHPDLFININRGEDPEARMVAFVQWYLTSFHAGRMDKVAKKPYNPIVGECFHCCWIMPPSGRSTGVDLTDAPSDSPQDMNFDIITYCAEQVSHHPPITAFHVESPVNRMRLDSCVHIKSKFQGMSVSVTLFGKTVLHLGEHDGEEYHFSFPIAYARSIMKTPWLELGDKVSINCPQTGYSASVNFFTKPLRGNKLHRITAEVFAPSNTKSTSPNNLVARVCGVWNGVMQFEQLGDGGKSWTIDVTTLPVTPKYVRPIDKQRPEESRRLWQHVTEALHADNIELATEKKREIPFPVKYFVWDGTSWNFRGLQKTPTPLISL
ncbi:unnamed protein product [Dicrocoelium dendriticum]|nr:unnamed protein product [Dicrocoelium dendriticum]